MRGFDVVLLTTRGRKTGRQRTTPLAGMRDGDDLFVIASNGGRPYHPAWFLNLRADPRVRLRVGNRITEVLSEIVPPAERERLWQMVIRRYPFYAGYQSSSRREIPLIRLRPQRM
jgi:deazaflavin-dependent oxidoreductase (nitroreductase family)